MHGKLRPVGSRVPLPSTSPVSMPWEPLYEAEYCASGTDALALAIGLALVDRLVCGQPEIIIPAYGCPDLVAAIFCSGATPVLVDLHPDTPFMDAQRLREALTERTVAVIGVGLLGIPERLERLADICREHSLALIEDSAQCFPPRSADRPVADYVVISFGRGKPINLMGGGALLYRGSLTPEQQAFLQAQPLVTLRTGFAWHLKRHVFNLLMTRIGFQLLEKVPGLGLGSTRFHPHRAITRQRMPPELLFGGTRKYLARPSPHLLYEQTLQNIEDDGWVLLGSTRFEMGGLDASQPRLRFGLLAPHQALRDEAVQELNASGIGANGLYEVALAAVEGVSADVRKQGAPVAADFAARLLTLPCHEDVTAEDVKRAARVLASLTVNGD